MNDGSDATTQRMQGRTTEDLLEIWVQNDRDSWTSEAFDSIRAALEERGVKVPEQRPFTPIFGKDISWISQLIVALGISAVVFANRLAAIVLGLDPPPIFGNFREVAQHADLAILISVFGGGAALTALGLGLRYSTLDSDVVESRWGVRLSRMFKYVAGASFLTILVFGFSDRLLTWIVFVAFPLYIGADSILNARYFACSTRAALLPFVQGLAIAINEGIVDALEVLMIAALVAAFASLATVKLTRVLKLHKGWRDRLRSSLRIGLIGTGVWIVLVLVDGAYDPRSAEGMFDLLANAFLIFLVLLSLTFVMKAIWYLLRKGRVGSTLVP